MNGDVLFDLDQFLHHLFIDVQASCRIQNHHVVSVLRRMLHGCLRNVQRPVVCTHGKEIHILLLRVDFQLFNGRRAVNIAGNQKGFLSLQLELSGQLRRCGGLTCTLKAAHHDHCGRLAGLHLNLRRLGAHQSGHFLIDDLDHHLPRIQAVHHVCTNGALLHGFDKLLHHTEVHVRFQKRHLHFLHGGLHIAFRQPSLAAQILEYILKFVGQAFKCHRISFAVTIHSTPPACAPVAPVWAPVPLLTELRLYGVE